MGDGGGHAVLNPKQPKPPIQKQTPPPTNSTNTLSMTQNPSKPLSHHPADYCSSNSYSQTTPYQHPNARSK